MDSEPGELTMKAPLPEVVRQPHECELSLSNAAAHIHEACIVLRQFMPEEDEDSEEPRNDPSNIWRHQIKKLRMAAGIVGNVRDLITNDKRFAVLQP
jgi:hypothetical protein